MSTHEAVKSASNIVQSNREKAKTNIRKSDPPRSSSGSLRNRERDKEINQIRRLNTLLRDEEKEAIFWEEMKNTNTKKDRAVEDESPDEGVVEGAATAVPLKGVSVQAEVVKTNNSNKSNNLSHSNSLNTTASKQQSIKQSAGGDDMGRSKKKTQSDVAKPNDAPAVDANPTVVKKHNSRKFDRHHQKDRSSRKFGPPPSL